MGKIDFTFNGNIMLEGSAFYNNATGDFLFSPDDPQPYRTAGYRRYGVAQQMTDGTFGFVPQPKIKSQSDLILKLRHGRLSRTKDGAVQLTLKVFADEGKPDWQVASTFFDEAQEAAVALCRLNGRRLNRTRAERAKIQDNEMGLSA